MSSERVTANVHSADALSSGSRRPADSAEGGATEAGSDGPVTTAEGGDATGDGIQVLDKDVFLVGPGMGPASIVVDDVVFENLP